MLLAIEWQSQPSTSPAIAIPILVQVPAGLSKKNAAAIPPMTIPAPTLFQNEAANLTRSLRCSVELLSKCSSSRMSVLLKYAVPVCCLEHSLPNAHRHLEEAVDDGDARHAVAPSSKLVWACRSRHRCQQRSCVFMADFWQSRRLWFSQQVRLAIFCLGVSAGGDYFDNTFLCVHLHSV